jgi:hypothetical protein
VGMERRAGGEQHAVVATLRVGEPHPFAGAQRSAAYT